MAGLVGARSKLASLPVAKAETATAIREPGSFAAIDCGTNSTRLLIVDGKGEELCRLTRITRLGQDVVHTAALSSQAVERTVVALREFREEMGRYDVVCARMVATAAVREAQNGQEFLDRASAVAGTVAELLSGEQEGRLAYVGATSRLTPKAEGAIVLDIGGGSTEMVTAFDGDISVVSLPLGCVHLTERYLLGDPPTAEQIEAAAAKIREGLLRAIQSMPMFVEARPNRVLIGLAGTVATLASLAMGLVQYTRALLHHFRLGRADVETWFQRLGAETTEERAGRPGMLPGRAEVIVAGALILREAMRELQFQTCVVSNEDILDGMIESLRSPDPSWP